MLKKYLSKLDTELDASSEQNVETTNNLNLLRHLINQNDKHTLDGLINNMDDLNNLNNLLNTLNKLVSHNSNNNSTNQSANCNSLFNSKNISFSQSFNNHQQATYPHHHQTNQQLNINNGLNNTHSNSSSTNHFYQQSISVDQTALNRKKSNEITNLLDLLQFNGHSKQDQKNKSKSINFLNSVSLQDSQLNQRSSSSVNHQVSHHNQLNQQLNKKQLKRNDSEHIQIEDDFLKSPQQQKRSSNGLKLLSLFQPTLNSNQLIGYENRNYNFNANKNDHLMKSNQATSSRKCKELMKSNFKSSFDTPSRFIRSESNLINDLAKQAQSSSNLINNNYLDLVNLDTLNKSKSDFNLSIANRKRQFFKK